MDTLRSTPRNDIHLRRKAAINAFIFQKYLPLDESNNAEDFVNIHNLFKFIGRNVDDSTKKITYLSDENAVMSRAYRAIMKETDRLIGVSWSFRGHKRTSKKEVSSLIRYYKRNSVRCPFKIGFIAEAIINIVENIESDKKIGLPKELSRFCGDVYRDAFFNLHYNLFNGLYGDERRREPYIDDPKMYDILALLYNEFTSPHFTLLNRRVK
jgi:hypothetical protein